MSQGTRITDLGATNPHRQAASTLQRISSYRLPDSRDPERGILGTRVIGIAASRISAGLHQTRGQTRDGLHTLRVREAHLQGSQKGSHQGNHRGAHQCHHKDHLEDQGATHLVGGALQMIAVSLMVKARPKATTIVHLIEKVEGEASRQMIRIRQERAMRVTGQAGRSG